MNFETCEILNTKTKDNARRLTNKLLECDSKLGIRTLELRNGEIGI